jgi:hypothetical protein|tara:strand:+ start:1690 stop:2235 length:546 start_codon:yes stop_codon:yes gene_type:complete
MGEGYQVIKDMRDQLYVILGKKIEEILITFEMGDYPACFRKLEGLKMLLDPQMDQQGRTLFGDAVEKINEEIDMAYIRTAGGKARLRQAGALKDIPTYLRAFMQMIFREMDAQRILFPKAKKYASYETQFMKETFGMESNMLEKKITALQKYNKDELLDLMDKNAIDLLYATVQIKNVLSK